MPPSPFKKQGIRVALSITLLALWGVVVWWASTQLDWSTAMSPEAIKQVVQTYGLAGPLVVIVLIALAIIFSPLPSAPVAVAAGALFGHYWGTLYVFLGSVLGASTAFMLARVLGYAAIHQWVETSLPLMGIKNQRRLMVLVFVSRLIPFISFDLVSYAAGLTPLAFWRFLLATAGGILPASFLLAHLGGELIELDPVWIVWGILLLAVVFIVPMAWKAIIRQGKKSKT